MANKSKTSRLGFSLAFLGHTQTEQELAKNFELLDKIGAPVPVLADVGKTLTIANVGGVPTPVWA